MRNIISVTVSKSGIPCLWERGGGWSNTGNTQIIADANGKPKRPLFVRSHGDLACNNHALIPVAVGDHVVTVDRHHDQVSIEVSRIQAIAGDEAEIVQTNDKINFNAIQAAVEKSYHYHCREPYYIAVPNPAPAPIVPPADDADVDFDDDDLGLDFDDELFD